ncbi:unnamed protein product, partial [Hymenolepis diminuta]
RQNVGVCQLWLGERITNVHCIAYLGKCSTTLTLGREWHRGASLMRDLNSATLYTSQT